MLGRPLTQDTLSVSRATVRAEKGQAEDRETHGGKTEDLEADRGIGLPNGHNLSGKVGKAACGVHFHSSNRFSFKVVTFYTSPL